MGRPSNRDARRQQIVQALLQVMAEKGFDRASMGDVAQAAGLTQGLLHYHFKNKEQMLLAALRHMGQVHLESLDHHLANITTPSEVLVAFIDFHLRPGQAVDPTLLPCWIVVSGEALRSQVIAEEFREILSALAQRLTDIVKAGITTGEFRPASTASFVGAMMATIQGYFTISATAASLIPKGSAAVTSKQMAGALLQTVLPQSGRT